MPVRFLSDTELARLSSWPDEIAEHDLVKYFTLTSDDAAWLSGNVRVENRLGAAVQLCMLPWLGWIPHDLHALRRGLFFAHQGYVRRRNLDDQVDQALCSPWSPTQRCYGPRPTWATPSTRYAPTATR